MPLPADNETRPLRVFTAGLGVETNTFSPLHIGLEAFERTFLYRPGDHPRHLTEVSAPLHVLRRRVAQYAWDLVEGTYAFALPAGRTGQSTYEMLRDEILEQLARAVPVDMVALSLHGAMCAFGYDDCEGDLLTRIRDVVGPTIPVGVEFDPHAHLSEAMLRHADILIAYKEYPHTDFLERGEELINLLEHSVRNAWRPVQAVFDCRTIGRFHTMREPMKGFVHAMRNAEAQPGIASVSLVHGFPWGDVADMGAKCLAVADDRARAEATARQLGQQLVSIREQTFTPPKSLDAALDAALAYRRGPVILADVSDNPGGGAPGDSTLLLKKVLAAGVKACAGPLWDPAAVTLSHAVGVGGRFRIRLGGKAGPDSGSPLDIDVEVTGLAEEAAQAWAGTQMSLGRACALQAGAVSIVVSSIRDQAYSPDLFHGLGIDPAEYRLVVVKSAQHFAAAFTPIGRAVVLAAGGGPLETDFRKIPYEHVPRPIWPLDSM